MNPWTGVLLIGGMSTLRLVLDGKALSDRTFRLIVALFILALALPALPREMGRPFTLLLVLGSAYTHVPTLTKKLRLS